MICNETSLLNQKATITYIQARIIAAHCEGDPECPDTETVWIVDSAELVAPTNLCQKDEVLYQGCDTTEGNVISFCTTEKFKNNFDKTPAYLVLRYGKPPKVGMEVISKPKTKIESRMARYAGANTRLVLRWQHEGQTYYFESAYIDAAWHDSARTHSLPLYEAKPATLPVVKQSARMSLFIVIDLRDGILIPEAPGPRRAVGGAARRANASDIRGASAVGFNASARPDARLRSPSRARRRG